jgi:hypothetical protein
VFFLAADVITINSWRLLVISDIATGYLPNFSLNVTTAWASFWGLLAQLRALGACGVTMNRACIWWLAIALLATPLFLAHARCTRRKSAARCVGLGPTTLVPDLLAEEVVLDTRAWTPTRDVFLQHFPNALVSNLRRRNFGQKNFFYSSSDIR